MKKIIFILLFAFSGIYLAHADVKTDYARFIAVDDKAIQDATAEITQLNRNINYLTQIIQNAQIDKVSLNANLNAVISANVVSAGLGA